MGWIISTGKLSRNGGEPGRNAGVIASANWTITSTPSPSGARWRFLPNAGRMTSDTDGVAPSWQARKAGQEIMSLLVGA